ncbi:alpha/beta hydrolase [Frondihabitans sp. PAMC 28766]|uniref:alpha/beta hydrolase n=1 Tax=Frondihabitans sp. PAMC 28766 TaxID=1795630 RepID=UPI00078D5060|nr:alpha/beta hydrolase [Frondihabitans sp. PAMC 28766]AMM21542.1 alpha/beta hydrolase [Frondihabitans sp. PAMC 28766]
MTREQRQAIDAQMRRFTPLFSNRSLDEVRASIGDARAGFATFMSTLKVPDGIRTSEVELGGSRSLKIEPTGESRHGTILYFHGGSFVVGSPETQLGLTAELVVRTGYTAYSVDYRLAPEHPFPAAIDDTTAAYRALLDDGHAPSSIAFAGDSAGGGLTITTLLRARELGLPMPAAVAAFSPGLDNEGTGMSNETKATLDPIITRESVAPNRALYRGDADPKQPLLSPAVYADPTGFPPLLLQVGTNEVLLDDSTRMAELARDAGVDVILDVTADVPHVFQMFAGSLDEAHEALDRAGLFLTQRIRP